jgi:hypothetical protein
MNDTITTYTGLLTQKKNSSPPTVGGHRTFKWENVKSKKGNDYIRIKNESPEYGGKMCEILNVEKTDFEDKYGNCSYNVEFTEVKENPTTTQDETSPNLSRDDYWSRKEARDIAKEPRIERQHAQEMAIMVIELTKQVVTRPLLLEWTDYFQRDISHVPSSSPRNERTLEWTDYFQRDISHVPSSSPRNKRTPEPPEEEKESLKENAHSEVPF